jgi:hypothetical protein
METLISTALRGGLTSVLVVVVILAIFILPQAVRILREYERGVIFRLGKLQGAKGPGLILLIPMIDKMVNLFPRRGPERGGREGGKLLEGDLAHRADDVAQRARAVRARRTAFATRCHQPEIAGDH